MRILFVTVILAATGILAFVGDRESTYNGIYVMVVAFVFMGLYLVVDLAFIRRVRMPARSGDEVDDTGSVEALYPKGQDTD